MRFADAGRPEQQHVLAISDPTCASKLAQLLGIDGGLPRKVEAQEIAHEWEAGKLQGHLDAPLVLAGDLTFTQQHQGLTQVQLLPAGFIQQAVELVTDAGQL
jgi:hypothetical protein